MEIYDAVAPFAGAWIEMLSMMEVTEETSRSLRGSVD